ncbi:hypothetical protein [Rhodococcus sp. 27YEA15]|uniref:TPR repeat region-containing protein n=1 Tax=Rhodococcus sp. 27YEA15 TaxID=3156259 RepID=UPI003C7AE66E
MSPTRWKRWRQLRGTDIFEIDASSQRARLAIVSVEGDGFDVSEQLVVTDRQPDTDDARVSLLKDRARELADAASATVTADETVRETLSATRNGLRATFVSVATSGGDQGRSDASVLVDDPSALTPERIRRLEEGGHLTAEQIGALERGDTATIPASQMEYLDQIVRSLDGRSPQEIEDLLSALPEGARTGVVNSLQIVSNEHVTASVHGDSEVPTNGGLDARRFGGTRQRRSRRTAIRRYPPTAVSTCFRRRCESR